MTFSIAMASPYQEANCHSSTKTMRQESKLFDHSLKSFAAVNIAPELGDTFKKLSNDSKYFTTADAALALLEASREPVKLHFREIKPISTIDHTEMSATIDHIKALTDKSLLDLHLAELYKTPPLTLEALHLSPQDFAANIQAARCPTSVTSLICTKASAKPLSFCKYATMVAPFTPLIHSQDSQEVMLCLKQLEVMMKDHAMDKIQKLCQFSMPFKNFLAAVVYELSDDPNKEKDPTFGENQLLNHPSVLYRLKISPQNANIFAYRNHLKGSENRENQLMMTLQNLTHKIEASDRQHELLQSQLEQISQTLQEIQQILTEQMLGQDLSSDTQSNY